MARGEARSGHMENAAVANHNPTSPNGGSAEMELLRNGNATREDDPEMSGNGVPHRNHESHTTRPTLVQWCRRHWKATASILCIGIGIGLGIGIGIGIHIRLNNVENTTEHLSNKTLTSFSAVPRGWVLYDRHQYYFSDDRQNWTSSIEYCKIYGAELADLQQKDMQEKVNRFKKHSDEQWCGAYMENGEMKWLNKTLEDNDGLKNISGSNCVIWNPGEFFPRDCAEMKPFICIKFPE